MNLSIHDRKGKDPVVSSICVGEIQREWEKVFNLEILRYRALLFIFGLVYF